MTIIKRIFLHLMFLLCDFNRALAANVIISDNSAIVFHSEKDRKPLETGSVVEYFKDHEVSSMQARENLRNMKESDFQTPAYCKKCSAAHQKYCHSENLLKDHCCCNQSHNKGEFIELGVVLIFVPSDVEGLHLIARNRLRATPLLHQFLYLFTILAIVIIRKNIQAWTIYMQINVDLFARLNSST